MNSEQCGGRPCIRGMRIRVVDLLELLAASLSFSEVLQEMPDLEHEDLPIVTDSCSKDKTGYRFNSQFRSDICFTCANKLSVTGSYLSFSVLTRMQLQRIQTSTLLFLRLTCP